jgi:hypothetical protein
MTGYQKYNLVHVITVLTQTIRCSVQNDSQEITECLRN